MVGRVSSDDGFDVRRAARRDLDALIRVCLEWRGAPAAANPALLRELLEQTLSDDDATVFLASDAAGVAGFAHVTYQPRPVRLGWRATVEELHALPGREGRVEAALLNAIVAECRDRADVIALYLLTQPDLEPRRYDFYRGLGFRERGREVLVWTGALE